MLATVAFASDITLTDGRVLRDATVQSQTPRTVVVRHATGMTSVPKTMLPPELQHQYPVDEAAAAEADRQAALAQEQVLARQKEKAEEFARAKEERQKTGVSYEEEQANEAKRRETELATVRSGASSCAEQYFEHEFDRNSFYDRSCEVTLLDMRPAEGWQQRWFVTGRVIIRYYKPYADETPREVRERNPGMSAKEARRVVARERYIRVETREFEGYYSTNGERPSIDITMR